MSLQLTINLATAEDLERAVKALISVGAIASIGPGQGGSAGINTLAQAHVAGSVPAMPPPATRPTALPPMPGNGTPPPPPPAAAPQPTSNPRLENVVKLMDAYSKGGNPQHGVAGVRKVLDVVGLKRAQDGDEAQLEWLEKAFANTAWTPG